MRKKIIALLICLSLFTGMIAGCGAKESEPESAGNRKVSESVVNADNEAVADKKTEAEEKSSYKVTGDSELDRAIYLGFVTKEELAEDKTVKGSEAFALAVSVAKMMNEEAGTSYEDKWRALKIYSRKLTRLEGCLLLFYAADIMGDEYKYVSDMENVLYDLSTVNWWQILSTLWYSSNFGEQVGAKIGDYETDNKEASVLFAVGRYALSSGKPLFEFDRNDFMGWINGDLTYYELIKALVRFYDSVPGTDADYFYSVYEDIKSDSFRIMINGELKGTVSAQKKEGEWQISASDAKSIFGDSVSSDGSFVRLREIAKAKDISYEPDDVLESAYFWTNETFVESPEIPRYRRNGNVKTDVTWLTETVIHTQMIPVGDDRVAKADINIVTTGLIDYASKRAEEEPELSRLTGFVLPYIGWPTRKISTTEDDFRMIANWGFNSIRVMLDWQDFFDYDMTEIDLDELEALDKLVAAAIKYDIHLDLEFLKMPGRWILESDVAEGETDYELDLFVNKKQQAKAEKMWRLFAKRYKDVPNRTLSFNPIWEASNPELSSTHPAPNYTVKDIAETFILLAKAIREESPDRLLLLEPCSYCETADVYRREFKPVKEAVEKAGIDNVIYQANFCSTPYVYAEMLPKEDGVNIDLMTHSMFKPEYPVTIYAANKKVTKGAPLTIGGFLPAGTEIVMYGAAGSGTLTVSADGNTLYEDSFKGQARFKKDYEISHFYPYAESDYKVTLTLEGKTEMVTFESTNSFEWSGIKVILPEEYAKERWYFYSGYDNYLATGDTYKKPAEKLLTSEIMICPNSESGGSNITVTEDLRYYSDTVVAESTYESVEKIVGLFVENAGAGVMRYETAEFNLGTSLESELAYYDDFMTVAEKNNIGWYSNDFHAICYGSSGRIANWVSRYYSGCPFFNPEFIKLFWKHQ